MSAQSRARLIVCWLVCLSCNCLVILSRSCPISSLGIFSRCLLIDLSLALLTTAPPKSATCISCLSCLVVLTCLTLLSRPARLLELYNYVCLTVDSLACLLELCIVCLSMVSYAWLLCRTWQFIKHIKIVKLYQDCQVPRLSNSYMLIAVISGTRLIRYTSRLIQRMVRHHTVH